MSDVQALDLKVIGARVRLARQQRGIGSLEELAGHLTRAGCDRPSTAKLSRIEAGVQPVTTDILSALADLTGISKTELRPDLAELMREAAE